MPVWLQIMAARYPPIVLIGGVLFNQKKILDRVDMHFNPESEVSKSVGGTLPERVKILEDTP